MFGLSEPKQLDQDNVEEFKRLASKVETIWMLSCSTCADKKYRTDVARNAEADLVGAEMSSPQNRKVAFAKEEIEFHTNSAPQSSEMTAS